MKMTLRRYDLPLKHPFTISRGTVTVRHALVVELADNGGVCGFGEATDNAYYDVTVDALAELLERTRAYIEGATWETPAQLWDTLQPHLSHAPFAQSAVDAAAHDLWGKRHGKPAYALWDLHAPFANLPITDHTIAIDTIDVMVRKMQEVPSWPAYKIKLGTADDIGIVRSLRTHTQAPFYLDANAAWTEAQARALWPQLVPLNVTLLEQPLPPIEHAAMMRLKADAPMPLIADESCQGEGDVDTCAKGFHGINIKLVKCGGLTPARRMIARARGLKLRVMLGCMTESTVGISAAAQLLPLVDYADLDGALLLADDIATGVCIDNGRVVYPDTPGCGVALTR